MKLIIYLAGFLLILNAVQASWLSDVFTGLNEVVDDSTVKKFKKTVEVLGTNVKKIGKDAITKFKEGSSMPNNDWVKVTKDFLHNIKFEEILKETGHEDQLFGELVGKWNKVKQELSSIDQGSKPSKDKYKQIRKDLKALLPVERFQEWKAKIHDVAKRMKEAVKQQMKNADIDILKKSVNAWMQPSFMENKENIEEEKQMVKDAVDAVNEKLKSEADKVGKKIVPLIKLTKTKEETDAEEESRVESWLQKKFTKPHHESGKSKWELLLKKMPLEEIKKKFKNVPFKQIKRNFKKMAKLNKKLVIVNEPIKTAVKVLSGKRVPIFLSKEDSKKLESLTPQEQEDYELAEAKWEAKVYKETQKLMKKWNKKEKKWNKEETKKKEVTAAPTEMMTGNEDWLNYDETEGDDKINFQQTKPKLLKKEFSDKLADEEMEWYALRRKMKAMLN